MEDKCLVLLSIQCIYLVCINHAIKYVHDDAICRFLLRPLAVAAPLYLRKPTDSNNHLVFLVQMVSKPNISGPNTDWKPYFHTR